MSSSDFGGVAPADRRRSGATRFATAAAAVLVAVCCATLAGCGFRLQGRAPLAPSLAVTYVDAENPQSDFVQELRKSLRASGVRLADSRTEAAVVVTLQRDVFNERVLSVSGRNLPREYELTYTVKFGVRAGDKELIAPEELTVSREMSFDERIALAKEREKEIQRDALARDLVGLVMRRLSTLR